MLDAEEARLRKTGTITISEDRILIEDFSGENCTCRDVAALALAWAIGVLQKDLVETMQAPGGGKSVIG